MKATSYSEVTTSISSQVTKFQSIIASRRLGSPSNSHPHASQRVPVDGGHSRFLDCQGISDALEWEPHEAREEAKGTRGGGIEHFSTKREREREGKKGFAFSFSYYTGYRFHHPLARMSHHFFSLTHPRFREGLPKVEVFSHFPWIFGLIRRDRKNIWLREEGPGCMYG